MSTWGATDGGGDEAERIVIVGGGPAGLAAARAYRSSGGRGEVTLLCEEPRAPYERPPLTKDFLRGECEDDALALEPPAWFKAHGVALCLGARARAIDPQRGSVALCNGAELGADAIVLATGSDPLRPDLPGAEHPLVQTFRTLPDSRRLALRTRPGRPVLVVGSGFIGCEIAGSLALRGVPVTLITQERLPQLERLGEEAALRIAGWLEGLGIELAGEASVSSIVDGCRIELEDGRQLAGEHVVLAAGVRPRSELAQAAGLLIQDGAVVVDGAMRASNGGAAATVLAAGDVAYAYNEAAGRHLHVEHWGDALGQGAVAGRTLAGASGGWRDVPGFWTTIGRHTLKYAAWGDGHDGCRLVAGDGGDFTIWYERDGVAVGVLTHERDADYERGSELIARGEPAP
jgi:3-phenylpropionate/trans-cinnamate dioxygenase ferredoxin reductase component